MQQTKITCVHLLTPNPLPLGEGCALVCHTNIS